MVITEIQLSGSDSLVNLLITAQAWLTRPTVSRTNDQTIINNRKVQKERTELGAFTFDFLGNSLFRGLAIFW